MALERTAGPLARCWRCTRHDRIPLAIRAFSTTKAVLLEIDTQPVPAPSPALLDPNLVSTRREERKLLKTRNLTPIGSRRRRAALQSSQQIPFEQLPYQCFQEARRILQEDRQEKLEQIRAQRDRIVRLKAQSVAPEDEASKEHRLASMRRSLEELRILADINDPLVKKRFEDGKGDMSKPIYRYLADKQWRSYKRNVLMQRITQMSVVPDVLPTIDPTFSVALSFRQRAVQHGDFVDSRVSESPPHLRIQKYKKGEVLVTVAVVNADVPNVEKDGFDYRCHFLAGNVRLSPTDTSVSLSQLSKENQVVLPWLPAYAQKGLPYQRMSVFVLEQPKLGAAENEQNQELDVNDMKQWLTKKFDHGDGGRHGFNLRSLVTRHDLKPVGVDLFRAQWDEGTAGVMQRAGIPGHDVEFKRKRIEPLPYKRLPGSKYR